MDKAQAFLFKHMIYKITILIKVSNIHVFLISSTDTTHFIWKKKYTKKGNKAHMFMYKKNA